MKRWKIIVFVGSVLAMGNIEPGMDMAGSSGLDVLP